MQAKLQLEYQWEAQSRETPQPDIAPALQLKWGLAKRIGFRLTFAYLTLFCFGFIPYCLGFLQTLFQKYDLFLHKVGVWYAAHVIHLSYPITVFSNGSGDTTYDWVLLAVYLNVGAIATVVWSLIDRKRPNYIKLDLWFRNFLRLFLAGVLVLYGSFKAFPLQMSVPSFTRLLQPYGESSPMGILWTFIGASPVYCSITGIVEMAAGILLLIPRTKSVGAILGTFAMAQVFILNMCYDVPVKILSGHLLLLSVFLMWPELRRMADLLIFNRRIEPVERTPLVTRKWPRRIVAGLAAIYSIWIVGANLYEGYSAYKNLPRITGKRPALYGIWNVDEYTVDGTVRPPLLTDESRWKNVIFQAEGFGTIKPMTGPNQGYSMKLDAEKKTMEFGKAADKNWKANLEYDRPDNDTLIIKGQWDGHDLQTKLKRFDESKFLLPNRGFHWISETPFNR